MRVLQEAVASAYDKVYGIEGGTYDATKWFVGKSIKYETIDGVPVFTPMLQVMRPMEESTAFYVGFPNVYQKSATEWYVFAPDTLVGATTRRVRLWTLNTKTGVITSNGFITLTKPIAGNGTVRDYKLDVYEYTTGTVSVSTATVTGSGTAWNTDRINIGARIGFGSTDPKQITTWYYINAVGSDTSITIQTNSTAAGTGGTAANISVAGGTAYVIQDFRQIVIETNATTTQGGVFLGKGIVPEDFTTGGTTIAAAVSTDKVKACYWLKDASTQTNIVACGGAFPDQTSNTSRILYVMDSPSAGNYKWYKYDIRSSLTLTTGAATNAFVLATGNNAVTGTISQNAACCLATASHGSGSGVESIYAVTTSRVIRVPTANITSGNTACVTDSIIEVPPGGTSTYDATGTLNNIEYSPTLDRFYISTSNSFTYLTKFVASGTQFDRHFGRVINNQDQSLAESDLPRPLLAPNGAVCTMCSITGTGLFLFCKNGTTAANNQIYVISPGADKDFAITNSAVLVTPKMTLSDAATFFRAYVSEKRWIGANEHMMAPEPFQVYFRTTNIDTDMTTGWQLLDIEDDLTSYSGASACQFRIVFQTLGVSCLPAQIISVAVAFDNTQTDSRWVFSDDKSTSTAVAFRQITQYGSSYPKLNVKLKDGVTGSTLVTDDSVNQLTGTWEKSTDGTTWGAYNTTDRASGTSGDNTFIRFTPTASLSGKVIATLY